MDMHIATTIRDQIGNRAFVMMGARDLLGDETGLQFKVGRNSKGVSCVRVELDPSDTYTVRFYKRSGKELASCSDVYCDSLRTVIEQNTGLYLSL